MNTRFLPLAGAFLAALVAVSCSREAGPGSATTTPSVAEAKESAPAPEVPQGPMPLEQAFDIADDVARPLLAGSMDHADGGILCSVDSVNEGPVGAAPLARDAQVRFSGFIAVPSDAAKSLLVLQNEQNAYFVRNVPTKVRADIVQSKGITEGTASDYSTFAALKNVAPGRYFVVLVSRNASAFSHCTSSEVTIQ